MKRICIEASTPYEVLIGAGLLDELGERVSAVVRPCRAAVVTDDVVAQIYLDRAAASLEQAGFSTERFVFPNGEGSKTLSTYAALLEWLAGCRLTRSDLVIALGGGVIGDLAGFAAARSAPVR